MKNRPLIVGIAALALVGVGWYATKGVTRAAPNQGIVTERKELALTIYHDDFGMVREVRPHTVQQGENHLYLREVSSQLDPQSILLRWLGNEAQAPLTTSQAYDLGVKTGEDLLQRYLGKEIEVVRYNQNGYPSDVQKGTLMAGQGGNFVLQSGDKFYIHPQGTMVAPTLPDVIPMPQVSLQVNSPASQPANLEFSYLTRGLSWSADYTGTLSPDSDTINLECWATVLNKTGANYPAAKVILVAGSPNRAVVEGRDRMEMQKSMKMTEAVPAKSQLADGNSRFSAPQALGDLHAYTVKTPTTVVQEQMNRLLMLGSKAVKVIRDYNTGFPPLQSYYGFWDGTSAAHKCTTAVALTFYNTEKNGLGEPLPNGAIRLYEPDASGVSQYIGAGSIGDTPKEEKIYLTLSSAFDVFSEWRLVQNKKIDKKTVQKVIEVTMHNQKGRSVELRAIQDYQGYWKMLEESEKSVKLNAFQSQWTVKVPANSKTVLRYTVEMKM
ncbi:MAG: hypothetical protein NT023_16645 [Armatimonadetes bacterium]|nr:hypothetical protein [Armatimonadota bacterium]